MTDLIAKLAKGPGWGESVTRWMDKIILEAQADVAGRSARTAEVPDPVQCDVCKGWAVGLATGRCKCATHAAETAPVAVEGNLQQRVLPWLIACFGEEVANNREERADRLVEELFELLQSGGYDPDRIIALRDYVWSRPVGEPAQEVGGTMLTLAAYCLAHGLEMHSAGDAELARVWGKVEVIRAKQAAKPKGSALPQDWHRADLAPTGNTALVEAAKAVVSAWAEDELRNIDVAVAALRAALSQPAAPQTTLARGSVAEKGERG